MGYDVSFFQVRHEKSPWQYKALSDGDLNPFQVFGGVMQAVREFLLKQKPNFMWFVADEPERARLYNRLLPKMTVPGYRAEVTDDGKYTVVKEAGAVVARFKQAVRDVGIEPT